MNGNVHTGKTTAMLSALSLRGTQKEMLGWSFFQLTAQCTLELVLDDLTNVDGIVGKIVVLFDCKDTDMGGETIRPCTSFMIALNMKQIK